MFVKLMLGVNVISFIMCFMKFTFLMSSACLYKHVTSSRMKCWKKISRFSSANFRLKASTADLSRNGKDLCAGTFLRLCSIDLTSVRSAFSVAMTSLVVRSWAVTSMSSL
uniref:(northern house mosquito) hypothetical protein n=1 Tax=Culex pipiens TaxID=7175 RepID=A0A8D8AHE5_CULPI